MGKYRNASENLRATLEESTGNIKKAAKEAGSIAAKTVEDVKDKVNELTESTEKKVSAVKKTVKDASEKKSTASKTGRKPAAKKEKASLAKNIKEKLTFEFNGAKAESADIMKRVEKDAVSKCSGITIKKLEVYFNANENTVYYVVNDEAKPEYKIVL